MKAPFLQPKDAVTSPGQAGIVSGNERREAMPRMHLAQQPMKRRSCVLVEVAGGFVREQEGGAHDQRPSDRDPLLLPARQHTRTMITSVSEANLLEKLFGASSSLRHRDSGDPKRHGHVLEGAELREKMVKLKDEANPLVAEQVKRLPSERTDHRVADPHLASVDAVEPTNHLHQGALPDPRRAHDRHHLSRIDRQVEIVQDG